MHKFKQSISVIFPAYNEEEGIESTLTRAAESLSRQFETYEIIVVNDGSTDNTLEIAQRLAKNNSNIRIINNESNLMLGASLLRGLGFARYDLVTYDAIDYPFDLDDLSKMIPSLEENDIVVAVGKRVGYSFYRKVISRANRQLLRSLFPLKLRDYNFVQVFKREVLQSVAVRARSTGFVQPELLLRAHDLGYRIVEMDITYLPRETGVARSGQLRVIYASLRDLLIFWLRRHKITRRIFTTPKAENIIAASRQNAKGQ